MNNNLKCAIAFISGAAIGAVVTWSVLKSEYERLTREGIESYKEAISKKAEKSDDSEVTVSECKEDDSTEEQSKPISPADVEVADLYAAKLKTLNYTSEEELDVEIASPEEENEEEEEEYEPASKPFVIEPMEYGEKDDYGTENLTYYADGVLVDNMYQPIDDIYGVVGNALTHFGDYEEDAVHVRNDRLKCDYEILREPRTYSECMAQKVPYESEE